MILAGEIIVYMDNMVIFAETMEELVCHTRKSLRILMKEQLYLNPEKCKFEKIEVNFCRAIIIRGEVDMEMGKIKCIVEWKTPTNLKELKKFLGFTNYYRKHIEAYSHIVKP